MNVDKLKGKMTEQKKNVDWLAVVLGCDRTTAYRKLNSFDKMTIGDAIKIKSGLALSNEEAVDIFL